MLQRCCISWIACLALLAAAAPAVADAAAAETTLKGKGLVKQGVMFVLDDESELTKGMIEIRKLQTDMTKASRELEKVERKMGLIKAYIAGKEFEIRKLNEELAKPGISASKNNELIAKINILEDDIKKVTVGPLKETQGDVSTAADGFIKARHFYIEKTVAMAEMAEKLKAKYEELGKDSEVTKALAVIEEETKRKTGLGPSNLCKANLTLVERNNKSILSEAIPVKVENDVPWVDVIINGKTRRSMVFDSGASSISVPWDLANDLNMIPSSDTERIRLQLADGKIVEGWRMTLKSVTVGPFTVENVECAVLPEDLVAAEPLLGGSFLTHFVYKLDLKRQKLDMTKVKTPGEK